jgi:hypothetical protein
LFIWWIVEEERRKGKVEMVGWERMERLLVERGWVGVQERVEKITPGGKGKRREEAQAGGDKCNPLG